MVSSFADRVNALRDKGANDAEIAAKLMTGWKAVDAVPRPEPAEPVVVTTLEPSEAMPVEPEQPVAVTTMTARHLDATPSSEPSRERAPQRRFTEHFEANPAAVRKLAENHPAVVEGRSLFPTTVVDPLVAPRLLVSGANQRKIGDRIVKGPWKGLPIYTLTLEERATCPRTCHHWFDCYGDAMPYSRRHAAGVALENLIWPEMRRLSEQHPGGFAVRVHVLGDFYSEQYAELWRWALREFPGLHIWGYTARAQDSDIGRIVGGMNADFPDRCAIRFSSPEPGAMRAVTIGRVPESPRVAEGVVCPAQTNATECCGTCGLCWATPMRGQSIAFVLHGRKHPGRKPKSATVEKEFKADVKPGERPRRRLAPVVIERPAKAVIPRPAPEPVRPIAELRPARTAPSDSDAPFLPDPDLDPVLEAGRMRQFWCHFLNLMIEDALSTSDSLSSERRAARAFLLGNSTWFRQVCWMSDLDPDVVRERLKAKEGLVA